MGIFKKKSSNKIGNGLTYVEADTTANAVYVYINGTKVNEWS